MTSARIQAWRGRLGNRFGHLLARSPLPEGAVAVGLGVVVSGITTYGFLVATAHVLGPARYASFAALWALSFLLAPGFFFPLEQEIVRALLVGGEREATRPGLLRQAIIVASAMVGLILAGIVATWPLLDRLFDGQLLLVVSLCLVVVSYAVQHLGRGVLAGTGRFGRYGGVLGGEGIIRLLGCIALAYAGVQSAGPYGLVVGLAPLGTIVLALRPDRRWLRSMPGTAWKPLLTNVAKLVAASLLGQALLNISPLLVKLLAAKSEGPAAGRFLAGMVLTRVPLFLFQAVLASLLPKLANLGREGRYADFERSLSHLVSAVVGVAVVGAAGAFVAGPILVRTLFGPGFGLTSVDLALLASASGAYMVALSFGQALVALSRHLLVAAGWAFGLVALAVVVALVPGLLARVELGFLAGSVSAAGAMAALVRHSLHSARIGRGGVDVQVPLTVVEP